MCSRKRKIGAPHRLIQLKPRPFTGSKKINAVDLNADVLLEKRLFGQ
jgi:hypothetical protein